MEDILQIESKESILFTFVVDPGRNGRNSTRGIILRNWAEVSQNAGSMNGLKDIHVRFHSKPVPTQ